VKGEEKEERTIATATATGATATGAITGATTAGAITTTATAKATTTISGFFAVCNHLWLLCLSWLL